MKHEDSGVDEPGCVEARRDACGPFVQVRWGWQVNVRVQAQAWAEFVEAVTRGVYSPERLPEGREWVRDAEHDHARHEGPPHRACVRFTIDERFDQVTPTGWRPKVFEVPEVVWDRFVTAARAGAFTGLTQSWQGLPSDSSGRPGTAEENGA
ncbi:hypothetical protein AB0J43_03995 [Nonomuraea fuscirosea]